MKIISLSVAILATLSAGCASVAVNSDVIEQRTAVTLGLEKGKFTISDRVDEGVRTNYVVTTSARRKFNCYVTGTVSLVGKVVSDAVCTEVGKPASSSNGTCNALLKAAGKCK